MKRHLLVTCGSLALLAGGARRAPAQAATATAAESAVEKGKAVYTQNCAACHMADGSGVPNMQPALDGDAVVKGDPATLMRVILQGPDKVLPEDREHYSNVMPAFATLDDAQIAAVLTYLRHDYGGGASAIDPPQVAQTRAQFAK